MSDAGVEAFRGLADWVISIDGSSDAWQQPSRCPGWTNQDILIHLACTLRELVEPETLPPPVGGAIERTNDVQVEAFRGHSSEHDLGEYRRLLPDALTVLDSLQSEDQSDETFSLEDAGVYLVHLSADALAFDHFCHLANDMTFGSALPPIPADLVDPAIAASTGWLVAGIPQMSGRALAESLLTPVGLRITGPGGGSWLLSAAGAGGGLAECEPTSSLPETVIVTHATDFMLWGTLRRPRQDTEVVLSGDMALAAAVADAIHVY